jgi:hypothetical protein
MFASVLFKGADAVVRARTALMGWPEGRAMVSSREALNVASRTIVEVTRNDRHPAN